MILDTEIRKVPYCGNDRDTSADYSRDLKLTLPRDIDTLGRGVRVDPSGLGHFQRMAFT